METKYFKIPNSKTKLHALTESQLRDHEILTTYMVLVKEGRQSYDIIKTLANDYSLSLKKIEQIVYPSSK